VEVIIAPKISARARDIVVQGPIVRLLECGELDTKRERRSDYKRVSGGLLVQSAMWGNESPKPNLKNRHSAKSPYRGRRS